ncbi:hypothetical protein SCLCIDRAFT_1220571 [Scleroderma citrinum Foug A]|uniref:Uncharacterized protein n=1 Tax=Scleroderma citrinum Foug A TaxID=1036808 RepID=A0A0C2Z2J7_9AGAM|nr:hypothetical protein SCLCIDRAFT_1220571 [Scleroderma citrinum Foug A]
MHDQGSSGHQSVAPWPLNQKTFPIRFLCLSARYLQGMHLDVFSHRDRNAVRGHFGLVVGWGGIYVQ